MFLIGQYDSPFVRRVAIAMRLYGLPSSTGRGRPSAMATRSRRIIRCGGCRRWCSTTARR